jgi:hypothetical protein
MGEMMLSKDEAARVLRTVAPDEAFYFYKGVQQPLGCSSKNLAEFSDMLKNIDPSSVKFHLEREDFESWFKLLGDQSLASQVASFRGKNIYPDELREKVSSMVRTRVDQLHEIANSHAVEREEKAMEKEVEKNRVDEKEERTLMNQKKWRNR